MLWSTRVAAFLVGLLAQCLAIQLQGHDDCSNGTLHLPRPTLSAATYKRNDSSLVIATSANKDYAALTRNMFRSMRKVGLGKLLVFCEDPGCRDAFKAERGIRVIDTGRSCRSGRFNSPAFNRLTSARPLYIRSLLALGLTVLWSDGDVAWLRNPLGYLGAGGYDVSIQDGTAGAEFKHACTGFSMLRPTAFSKHLVQQWGDLMRQNETRQDQFVFNDLIGASSKYPELVRANSTANSSSLCLEAYGQCTSKRVRVLDRRLFPTGCTYPQRDAGKYMIAHASCRHGIDHKIETLKGWDLWYED